MSFGQSSGPPASTKQIDYLLALVRKAGHDSFRDARRPLGLTQRQSSGKFTRTEASALIDQLVNGGDSADEQPALSFESSAAAARIDDERARVLSAAPAQLLADELQRRGWVATPPGEAGDSQSRAG
ncbi:MAG TPA: hypothetical protein VNB24_00890 [Acidimicrobiales bacterium]|nr:hypothetical protein [Acidimicrobiales bacterium]